MGFVNDAKTPEGDAERMGAISPPADMTIPPPGIRQKIWLTAEWVLGKGHGKEEQLRERSGSSPQFSFLNPADAYHPFYQFYLQQLREGVGAVGGSQAAGQAARPSQPKGPVEPPKFRFSARMPNISAKDLEVLRLTALYTAKNGENWLKELRAKEAGNFQFDFLRPTHSFFQFFRAIVDQYKILLEEDATVEARIEELQKNLQDRFHVLERAKQRAEFLKHVTQQKEAELKKKEDEAREFASIDWNDFAVIATVTFDESDDAVDLPPPTSKNDLQSASLEQKAQMSLNRRIEEAAPDDDYYNVSQQPPAPTYTPTPSFVPAPMPMAPPVQPIGAPPPMPGTTYPYRPPTQPTEEEQNAERERARAQAAAKQAPGSMRIRNDYVPRAAAKKGGVQMVLCKNCGQQIPANEYDEHVRIELLDPRWKEQREKADARYSTTINTVDVANNLKRFASQRDDIYDGVTGMPISEEEANRRKKAATSYDGTVDPARDAKRLQDMQSLNVQEQLRRIQERHGAR
ncbi:hypothetical protein M011DRAFT_463785 [Sporormia fimetaria CBS 119925]|uniref:SURP motif domain-containing protein n=1 Tax=Sporormia fimetaria CBS 119925 TaxID=1340428 RepID=A0A6A6VSU2_9PLEO|nr:hypothetical protein M011DRAFT_463785 [Sporormia fimetaria CBS 119925]